MYRDSCREQNPAPSAYLVWTLLNWQVFFIQFNKAEAMKNIIIILRHVVAIYLALVPILTITVKNIPFPPRNMPVVTPVLHLED